MKHTYASILSLILFNACFKANTEPETDVLSEGDVEIVQTVDGPPLTSEPRPVGALQPIFQPIVQPLLLVNSNPISAPLGWNSGAGSNTTVTLGLSSPTAASGLCKFYKKSESSVPTAFTPCGTETAGTLKIDLTSLAPEKADGTYVLEAKAKTASQETAVVKQEIYMHSSLNGAGKCESSKSDQEYFAKAAEYLTTTSVFGSLTAIKNPEIKIVFADNFEINPISLRRRFAVSPDKKLLLMRRQYQSKLNSTCTNSVITGETRTRTDKYLQRIDCEVLVFNAQSAGVCLKGDGNTISFVRGIHSVKAKLSMHSRFRVVSAKTKDIDAANDHTLYIPD